MLIHVIRKRWRLRFTRLSDRRGDCDAPTTPHKAIRVDASLAGEERLEVLLHELLHAAGWPIDEGFVTQFAADAARVLWRLGYREHSPIERSEP